MPTTGMNVSRNHHQGFPEIFTRTNMFQRGIRHCHPASPAFVKTFQADMIRKSTMTRNSITVPIPGMANGTVVAGLACLTVTWGRVVRAGAGTGDAGACAAGGCYPGGTAFAAAAGAAG